MVGTEKLTQKALEQHDKIHPKFQATKTRTTSQSKTSDKAPPPPHPPLVKQRSRLVSYTESTKSSNGHHEPQGHQRPFERQGSRGSMLGAVKAGSKPGNMSVFRVVAAARAWRRRSQRKPQQTSAVPEKPKVAMENTYRLEPKPGEVFKPEKVRTSIKDVLTTFLKKFNYTPENSKQMSLILSNEIKSRVKAMNFARYKIVCNIMMMQNKGQGSEVSSRCVWNPDTDSFASYTHATRQVICVANVHAVYFE